MALFQKPIIDKYLAKQDKKVLATQWHIYRNHFHNPDVQENIRNSKEEQYQEGFLRDLFVKILGYTLNPDQNFNLTTELKNVKDSKKADGAMIFDQKVITIIELKGTNTTDLNRIEVQAFGYKNNQPECMYVITSNFEKLRFYIDNAIENIEFNLFKLTEKEFEILYLCLSFESMKNGLPKLLKQESLNQEDAITKKLYQDYSAFKNDLYQNLLKNNPQFEPLELFKKSQKLLDRFLFLFFAEDKLLVQPNSVRIVVKRWKENKAWAEYIPLYVQYKKYFEFFNTGIKSEILDIYPYNGGLFEIDLVLDQLKIDDQILEYHTLKMSDYDFNSEVDVNILGHIFENSLNEIDEIRNSTSSRSGISESISKRKKDGVFYTPKYITKYIVENTVGKLCVSKKTELQILDNEYVKDKKRKKDATQILLEKLKKYREWLLQITIIDPACGSGAFLNEALNFLIAEHAYIDELQAKLFGDSLILSDVEKSILENNLFGVDINEESVDIAKLSLWLRTARPERKLNNLNANIKCGNSLISDSQVTGSQAFDWEKEFPQVFEKGGFDVVIGNPPYVQLQSLKELSQSLENQKYETFEKMGDLYCLFYEKGAQILKNGGILGYITSNKWMRANYGKSLRKFFTEQTQPLLLADLGSGIFESATVDSNILIFRKEKCEKPKPFYALDLSKEKDFKDFSVYENRKIEMNLAGDDVWTISNPLELQIKRKIEKAGMPLKDWEIQINYGIKTGFNEAFIIDESTKNELILEDFKSAEIIKPILRGRDIKRYYADYANLYLISTFPALKLDIENYPAVKKYLLTFAKERLEQLGNVGSRKKTGNKWFETQDQISYYEEFAKEKIVWAEMTDRNCFIWDDKKMYYNQTCYFIPNGNKYMLAVLNSQLVYFYFSKIASDLGNGAYRWIKQFVEKIPIPQISEENQQIFIEKADLMLSLNKNLQEISQKFQRTLQRKFSFESLPNKLQSWYLLSYKDFIKELEKKKVKLTLSQESEWEEYFTQTKAHATEISAQILQTDQEIDALVYELYNLNQEEIEIVEKM